MKFMELVQNTLIESTLHTPRVTAGKKNGFLVKNKKKKCWLVCGLVNKFVLTVYSSYCWNRSIGKTGERWMVGQL